jgi:hypothetical protein
VSLGSRKRRHYDGLDGPVAVDTDVARVLTSTVCDGAPSVKPAPALRVRAASGLQNGPQRRSCGPFAVPRAGNSREHARTADREPQRFSLVFPRVRGCSQFQRKSGRQDALAFPMRFLAPLRSFRGPNSAAHTTGCVAPFDRCSGAIARSPPTKTSHPRARGTCRQQRRASCMLHADLSGSSSRVTQPQLFGLFAFR